jgi:hypothetical protein
MFYSVTTIGKFTVIFHAGTFTSALTRQKAPKESTHFIIYSIAKGKEYYIPNDTIDAESKGKILLNTHAFFRDEKSNKSSNKSAESYIASLVTNDKMEENSDLMDQLRKELRKGTPLPKTPSLRRRSSLLRRRRSLPRTPSLSLRRRSSLPRTPSLSVRRRHLPKTPSQYKKIIKKRSFINQRNKVINSAF